MRLLQAAAPRLGSESTRRCNRPPFWLMVDEPCSMSHGTMVDAESDGAESDGKNVTAMLASLGCGEALVRSIPVDATGGDSLSDSRVAGEGAAAGGDAARARKVQNLTAMLGSLGCGEVLARSIPVDTAEVGTMWYLAQPSQENIAELFQTAAVEMAARVGEGVETWKAGTTAAEEADASGKFVDGKYGGLELFDTGLEGYVGLPDVRVLEAMIWEHASTEKFTPSNNEGTRP